MKVACRQMSGLFVSSPEADRISSIGTALLPYLVATVALSLTFTFSGAYDTDNLTLLHRLSLWIIVCGLIVFQTLIAASWLEQLVKIGRLSGLVSVLGTVLATNLLVSAELYTLKYTPLLPKAHDPFLELFLFVLLPVSTISISVIMYRSTSVQPFHRSVLQREIDAFSGPVSDTKRERSSRPAGWPLAPILLVHACDHYLEIRTSEGKVFLKGRMKDAVTYLALFDGAQVHRSWWVAKSFVTTIERQGRDWVIFSEFGDRIPIGRGRTKLLRELDWPFE